MEWNIVKIDQTGGKSVPYVSIGRGEMDFSAAACELIEDNEEYKYAQILTGKENGKAVVAVKLLKESESDTIAIKRKYVNGKLIKGFKIVNKGLITKLFGKVGSNDGRKRYKVELVKESESMLKIID